MTERSGERFDRIRVDTFRKKITHDSGETDGSVVVRAPLRLAKYRIERFVTEHEDWIRTQQKKVEKYREQVHVITEEERRDGILRARKIFPERTAYFAKRMGVTYNRITEDQVGKLQFGRKPEF